jgi:hypothetical protein
MRIHRRVMRWDVQQGVKVLPPGSDAPIPAVIHDISLKGMRISLDEPLPTRIGFSFTVVMPDQERLSFDCWAAWRREEGARRQYGLYFTRIQDRDKEKICRLIRQEYPQCLTTSFQDSSPGEGHVPDRRMFQRFSLRCRVALTNRVSGVVCNGETVDFCAKGLGVCLEGSVEPQKRVIVQISLPGKAEPFDSEGRVVWSSVAKGGFCAGINLDSADLMGLPRALRLC